MLILADTNAAAAVYASHEEADAAIKALARGGFDMQKLSVVGADFHTEERVVGYYTSGDRMKAWGVNGAFWGGIWGLIFGSAFFLIPGIGPIVAAGPLVASIVSVLEGAAMFGGLSALGAGLVGLGIPKDSIVHYETELKAGRFLVVATGSRHDAALAKEILSHAGLVVPHLHPPMPRMPIYGFSLMVR